MTAQIIDTYDVQMDAIMANDPMGFYRALKDGTHDNEQLSSIARAKMQMRDLMENGKVDGIIQPVTLFPAAWRTTGDINCSLFAYLPEIRFCASQIDNLSGTLALSKDEEAGQTYDLIHKDHPEMLKSPNNDSIPTREWLQEFARRQRLCRGLEVPTIESAPTPGQALQGFARITSEGL